MPEVVMQTKGEFSRMKVEEEPEDIWWIIWVIIGIACSLACSSCFIILFLWYRNRRDDDGTHARLPMNAMDSKGQTGLYKAVLAKKWYRVKDLLENGALVDATCGPYLRTALFELVLMKDKEHAKDFLDAGAYILQPDVAGYYPEQYADEGGFMLLFDGYSKENQRKRVIPPNTPRPYKILVVDKDYIPRNERKNLPKRIRKKITWGYNESMDLDKFTHIVIKPAWKTETEKYTLAPFRFVLECIARYQILPIGSTVIQMNEENGADGVEGTKSKEAVNVPTTPTNVEPVTP
ncbi:hypothetical protein L3Y34_019257 [Caenorhabditis briggsae]|uniref:Uncharacterized protein n=1 Tax=Caenorhabditis briggsae TaxID=6238 RepID=A0AAE9IWG8_CAEBR|nr:hypothetical protein L3Y34_019257 [Caenorhabditis briggsae]